MKLSVCLDLLYLKITQNGPVWASTDNLIEGMELAKKAGYTSVEFWNWYEHDMSRLVAKKDELDLSISAICAKDRGLIQDPAMHQKSLESLIESIEAANILGCPNIIITVQPDKKFSREETFENSVKAMKMFAPYAEDAGVTLILEPISGGYFIDSEEPFRMIDAVDSPSIKLLYDIFHYQIMEGNIVNTIHDHLDKIGHLHAAGAPTRTEITNSEINYGFICKSIEDMGYSDYFALEYLCFGDKSDSLTASRNYLKKFVAIE